MDIALGLRGAEGDRFPGSSIIELPFVVPSALQDRRRSGAFTRTEPLPPSTRTTRCSHCSCTIPA